MVLHQKIYLGPYCLVRPTLQDFTVNLVQCSARCQKPVPALWAGPIGFCQQCGAAREAIKIVDQQYPGLYNILGDQEDLMERCSEATSAFYCLSNTRGPREFFIDKLECVDIASLFASGVVEQENEWFRRQNRNHLVLLAYNGAVERHWGMLRW